MGARESTGRSNRDVSDGDDAALDYYQILEVAEDATADEIKVPRISFILFHLCINLACLESDPFDAWR
jgi:hypothetical protein